MWVLAAVGDLVEAVDDGERVEALAKEIGYRRLVREGVARVRGRLVALAGLGGVGVAVARASDGGGVCNAVGAGAGGGQYRTVGGGGGGGGVEGVDDLLGLAAGVGEGVVVVGRRGRVGSAGLRGLRGLLP